MLRNVGAHDQEIAPIPDPFLMRCGVWGRDYTLTSFLFFHCQYVLFYQASHFYRILYMYRVSEVVMSHKNILARNFRSKMQTQLKFFSKNIST